MQTQQKGRSEEGEAKRQASIAGSAASAVREEVASCYRSELAVAQHEVGTLPSGREVFVRKGNVFLLADVAAAQVYLRERQDRARDFQKAQKPSLNPRS